MRTSRIKKTAYTKHQKMGAYALLDALVGMLIFSIGVLGLIAMQGNILNRNMDSGFRTLANLLANELVGMAIADYKNSGCYAVPTGACSSPNAALFSQNWANEVTAALPSAAANPPTVTVDANKVISVTIYWHRPDRKSVV